LTDDQSIRSMRVDMIGASCASSSATKIAVFVPVGTMRNSIDYAAEREIVIGDGGLLSWLAGTLASGMLSSGR